MIWDVIVNVMVSYENIEADTRAEAKKIAMEKAFEVDFSGSDFWRVSVNSVSSDGEDENEKMENEQIEEMAKIAAKSDKTCRSATIALRLYAKGYRKVERGEWKIVGDIEKFFMCTACNSKLKLFAKFCPECGADMRGE